MAVNAGHRPKIADGKLQDLIDVQNAHVNTKFEHSFRVIKHLFGFQKTSLRGLNKKTCKINVLAALTNLFLARPQMLATV